MRLRALVLAGLLLVTVLPPAAGQGTGPTQLDLGFTLDPTAGTVDVQLTVQDPGALVILKLDLGQLDSLEGQPRLGPGWTQEGGTYVVDLRDHPNAQASWTTDGQIEVVSHNGEGFTTYVSESFAVVKAGDMMPTIGYQSPAGTTPSFETTFRVDAPEGWTTVGPWPSSPGGGFQLADPIPRGFLVAGPDVEEIQLGEEGQPYRIVRVEGAREDADTERILLEARSYLGGIYGEGAHQRFIVVAPDPMFQGGLGSPDGVFVHEDADARVVAHEMVHAFQRFRISREPGEASIWLVEGTAVLHGALLEVAAGVTTREDALEFLEDREAEARRTYGIDLTTAVYGGENERGAYTKGPTVVSALSDGIRRASDEEYTIADVLQHLNEQAQGSRAPDRVTTSGFLTAIGDVTGFDFSDFFDRYVYGADVPPLGSVFPGQASIRVLGTEPDPPVTGEAFDVKVSLTNLDTSEVEVDEPVLVDGQPYGRLRATLPAGGSAEATASVTPLPRGTYSLQVGRSSLQLEVLSPAQPSANVTVWPPSPSADRPVTFGVVLGNRGEAPLQGPVSILLDGSPTTASTVDIAAGEQRTLTTTIASVPAGEHLVQAQGPNGSVLASMTVEVTERGPNASPGPGVVALVTILAGLAALAPARLRRR